MPEDVAGLAERILDAAGAESGRDPAKVTITPNGAIEVNVQVSYRGERHPDVFFRSRQSKGAKKDS
jgi:hypothetical protein